VGLLAVEFFLTPEGKLLINEFAPRPHNTGHYTLDGAYISQFENLVRVITDIPAGSTKLKLHAGMVNIIGMSLEELDVSAVLSVEGAKLYWYGKEKRTRRKMGHINVVAQDTRRKMGHINVVAQDRNRLMDRIDKILNRVYGKPVTSIVHSPKG